MSGDAHSVLVVDDHPLFRRGVTQLLDMEPGFSAAGEASTGEDGLRMALELSPDLVLLDLNMQDLGGIEVLRRLKEKKPDICVVVLTVSDHPDDVISALRLGADGYLLKDTEPEDIMRGLREIAEGRVVLSESLTGRLAQGLREEGRPTHPSQAGLTARERDVLDGIAAGLSNKLIARRLDIAESTVKVHVKHVLKKLNVRSRLEAAVWSKEQG